MKENSAGLLPKACNKAKCSSEHRRHFLKRSKANLAAAEYIFSHLPLSPTLLGRKGQVHG